MDTQLKPMSGFETARRLKQHYPGIKIILLSETGSESELCESVLCGVSGFLRKDFKADTLFEMLNLIDNSNFTFLRG